MEIEQLSLSYYLETIVGVAWLCEKLGINVKFTFPDTYGIGNSSSFENPVLNYAKTYQLENFTQLKKPLNIEGRAVVTNGREQWDSTPYKYYMVDRKSEDITSLKLIRWYASPWRSYSQSRIPKEYGHKIISKLSIRQEIQQQADQWCDANIKGECVGVHYRQTDAIHEKRIISIDSYIDYLKQVLDDHYQIYACSDNVRFIQAIHKAFSGRVVGRDITRSKDGRSLHRHEPYVGHQQR